MNSKILHYVIAILFLVFGIIQYNDPDFWLWGPIYFLVALVPIFYLMGLLKSGLMMIIITAYALFILSYIPDFIFWINEGMPNIAESMKAEEPHIELTREFLGLVICMIALVWYYWKSRPQSRINN